MTHSNRMYYLAGQETGLRVAHMARAQSLPPGSAARRTLVRLARQANWERLKFVRAAQGEST